MLPSWTSLSRLLLRHGFDSRGGWLEPNLTEFCRKSCRKSASVKLQWGVTLGTRFKEPPYVNSEVAQL